MKAFAPMQLVSEAALSCDTLNSFSDRHPSKTELRLQQEAACDDAIIKAKMKYYKTIMESDNEYEVADAKEEMDKTIKDAEATKEAFIHGLEVDAESIFDNGTDDGEFNRTEWMDLTLENAYELDKVLKYVGVHQYLQEAQVLLDPDSSFEDMIHIQEAVVNRIKNAVNKAIQAVKQLVNKFIEKVRAIGRNHTPYLKKYKETILNQRPKSEVVKIRDFETAMKRIMNSAVPNVQYNQLKNALNNIQPDQAEQAVFDKIIKGRLPDFNSVQSGPNDSIADICKIYFCCSEQAPMIERDMQTFNMTDIYNFLIDTDKIVNQIKKDMKSLETNANMLATAAEKENPQQQTNNSQPAQQSQPQPPAQTGGPANGSQNVNASAIMFSDRSMYSSVLESVISLQEFEVAKQQQPKSDNMGARMQNVQGDNYKDQNAADQDLKNAGGGSDQTRNEVATYVKVAQTVLAAKMTSVEFFSNELFKLVRHHVQNFIQGDTAGTAAAQQGTV